MALSLGAAILGSALIGGAASVATSRSATRSATNAAEAANASNERIARETRDLITQQQQPFYQFGTSALPAILQQLGLPYEGGDNELGNVDWNAYVSGQSDVSGAWSALSPAERAQFNNDPAQFGQYHYQETVAAEAPRDVSRFQAAGPAGLQRQVGVRPEAAARPTTAAPAIGERTALAAAPQAQRGPAVQRPAVGAAPDPLANQAPATTGGYGGSAFSMPSGVNPMAGTAPMQGAGARPAISAFETASERPEIAGFDYEDRPEYVPPDVSASAFMASPDYAYRQGQAARDVGARFSAIGALESGAAQSSLLNRYMENYGDWRDYTTDQSRFEAQRQDAAYSSDRDAAQQVWTTVQALRQQGYDNDADRLLTSWQTEQTLRQQGYTADADRASADWRAQMQDAGATLRTQIGEAGATSRTAMTEAGATSRNAANLASENWRFGTGLEQSAFEADRAFGESAHRYDTDNALDLYRYTTDRGDARFDADRAFDYNTYVDQRNFTNTNYDLDRARTDAIFDTDRNYLTGRYDQQTANLFGVAGMGQNAANALSGTNQNYANTLIQGNTNMAGVQGNAAIANANSVNNAIGQGLNAFGYYAGSRGGGAPATGGGSAFYYPTTLNATEASYLGYGG